MNKFSKTLAVLAIAGSAVGCATAPGTAQAGGTEEVLIALGTAFLFNELYKDRTEEVGRVEGGWGSEHNPLNESHRPGYAAGANNPSRVCKQEVIRHGNYAEVVDINCYGVVLNTRIIRR